MGPNGSGKSTLAEIITRDKDYIIKKGEINYNGTDIIDFTPDKCAEEGIFMSFQNPIEIPGISNINFLKQIYLTKNNKNTVNNKKFTDLIKMYMNKLGINNKLLYRSVNNEFSGGEKKKNEILQFLLLNPELTILDEIDSGLDVDALKIISKNINEKKNEKKNLTIIIITHYNRILNLIKPDFTHILLNGKIIKTGDHTLPIEIDKKGYNWLTKNE
jgi:Fe-S cluster assembly ATP-binding protein